MTNRADPPTPDAEQFAGLFERYKNLVYKTSYLMLSNAGEAEEATQEVFVLVYRSLADYDPARGAFTTWLHRITLNYCLGMKRKRRLPFVDLESQQRQPAAEPAVEASLARRSDREAVRLALEGLSEKQRAVVILRYYHDLPYAEIAEVLKIPLGTVKSRLDLALRTLRQKLDAKIAGPIVGSLSKDEVTHEL